MTSTNWSPDTYARHARFVSDLGVPLIGLLNPRPGENILDLGCGDGALTEKIAEADCRVFGVDASLAQVYATRNRGLRAFVMDGQCLGLKPVFDAVFTNAALHWMPRAEKVAEGVAHCLKPGGRFVGEFGGKGNVEKIHAAIYCALRRRNIDPKAMDPWYYPSPEIYFRLLASNGFRVDSIELIPRPTQLPGDILDWLGTFAQPFINAVSAAERPEFLGELRAVLESSHCDTNGRWFADYVRLRFKAIKKDI